MKIKLLVCYHKPAPLLKDNVLTPIHVGRALAKKRMNTKSEDYKWLMKNLIGDDTGENISEKNGSYNEMTSLYWAWKNYDKLGNPDYIGLMHYRRHFVLREGEIDVVHFDDMDEHYFEEINYSEDKLQKLVNGCDYIAHIGKVNNVYNHYIENHRQDDLDLAFEIMNEKYPEYRDVTKEYLGGDYSNFCNMFIFSRELFFQYCSWIFDILEEFEKRVDVSEKRFFISERLTGVFIAKLMKDDSLKYKVIPISFVSENVRIPIVMPVENAEEFAVATTVTSLLTNKNKESRYEIYLLGKAQTGEKVKKKYAIFEKIYENCSIHFISTQYDRAYYPILIPELLPDIKKCIYMEDNSIVLTDLSEFFRTCSVDDFFVVGAPLENYDIHTVNKKLNPSFIVMNCASLKKHGVVERAKKRIEEGIDGITLFNELLKGQIGYVPWYFMTLAQKAAPHCLFDHSKTRGSYQADAVWKPIMFYDNILPWEDPQGVYSNFWWDMAEKVPAAFKFVVCSLCALEVDFSRQQIEINRAANPIPQQNERSEAERVFDGEGQRKIEQPQPVQIEHQSLPRQEDWRSYNFWGKLKFYYVHNGMKKTFCYGFQKLLRGGK